MWHLGCPAGAWHKRPDIVDSRAFSLKKMADDAVAPAHVVDEQIRAGGRFECEPPPLSPGMAALALRFSFALKFSAFSSPA
jgi:hypothetical protein